MAPKQNSSGRFFVVHRLFGRYGRRTIMSGAIAVAIIAGIFAADALFHGRPRIVPTPSDAVVSAPKNDQVFTSEEGITVELDLEKLNEKNAPPPPPSSRMPDRTRPTTAISFIRELVDATSEAFAQDASMPDSGLLPRSGLPTPRNPIAAQVIGPNGRPTNIEPLFVTANNKARIFIHEPKRNLRPGRYLLRIWTLKGGVIYYSESSFLWGVLVVNTDKSIYTLGNIAKLSFGVLDNFGRTLCDAHITATITAPSGAVTTRSTEDGSIVSSPE